MAFTLITITSTNQTASEQAATGTITATLSQRIQNGVTIIDPTPITGQINASGQLVNTLGQAFQLVANDDPSTLPQGSYYTFTVQLDSAPVRAFNAIVSHTASGGTVDLSALEPTTT